MRLYKEDLFSDPKGLIAHGVNAQGVMGSGVAKVIRDRFPKAYEDYREYWEASKHNKPSLSGKCQFVTISDELTIANCFTQNYYGRTGGPYADFQSIYSSLSHAAEYAKFNNLKFKMPMIGCGLGGLKWSDVSVIIRDIETNIGVTAHVFYL